MKKTLFTKWRVSLAALLLLFVTSNIVAQESTPAELIKATAGNLLEQIDQRRDEFEANPAALTNLVREELMPLLDQSYSARLILGRHGRGIPPEKIEEFSLALGNALTSRYSTGLLGFQNRDQMEILPANPNDSERQTKVRTRIKLKNGGAVPVDYMFRKTEEGWKVFDVTIEGISYVMTFRNQLGPKVAANGIDAVTAELNSGNFEVSGS